MKFQKFYIYFCSISWIVWSFSILLVDVLGHHPIYSFLVYILTIIPYFLSITPVYTVFFVIALVKSIKIKKAGYIIFNIVSIFVTLILGLFEIVFCAVFYSGGA